MAEPLAVRSLHHIGRLTKRLEESKAFYRNVLGFREIPRPSLRFPGAWLSNYGIEMHLIVDESIGGPEGPIGTRDNHLAFLVDDLDTVERLLGEHGIEYKINLQADTKVKQVFFRDPDGHHIEVGSYGRPA